MAFVVGLLFGAGQHTSVATTDRLEYQVVAGANQANGTFQRGGAISSLTNFSSNFG